MSRVCWTQPRPVMEFPVFNGTVNAALALSMTVEPASERISPRPWGRAPRPQHEGYRQVCPTMVGHRGPLAQAHIVRKRTASYSEPSGSEAARTPRLGCRASSPEQRSKHWAAEIDFSRIVVGE